MTNEEVIATKPQGFSTAHKSLIFLAVILLIALFSGICGYLLGVRTDRPVSRPLTRDVYQPSSTTIPFSTPVIPLPPVTPGWKLLQSTEMHFAIQYPSTL